MAVTVLQGVVILVWYAGFSAVSYILVKLV
jgi:hypothetical protein